MDLAWGEHFWREDVSHPVHHEGCFSGLLRIHRRVGRNRELHEGVREREGDSRRGHQPRDIETGAVTVSRMISGCRLIGNGGERRGRGTVGARSRRSTTARRAETERSAGAMNRTQVPAEVGRLSLRQCATVELPVDAGFLKVVRGPVAVGAGDRAGAGRPGISRGVGWTDAGARGSVGALTQNLHWTHFSGGLKNRVFARNSVEVPD